MRDYDIKSDLKQEQFQTLKLVQGDRGNKIKINVFEEGQPVNLAGCSVTAKYKRSDGEVINNGIIEQEFSSDENFNINYFYAVMDSDITKVAGTLKMLFTIEKDDVKVSTFLLLADVREGIGENTGSSGGNTGDSTGEVTVDLSNYYKKSETYSRAEIDAQFKDIANELGKDEHGNFTALETTAQTIIGAINELKNSQGTGESGLDLSSLIITTESADNGTRLVLTDGTTTKEVNIPSATETQVKSVIDGLITDGTISSITLGDNSVLENNIQDKAITEQKTTFFSPIHNNEMIGEMEVGFFGNTLSGYLKKEYIPIDATKTYITYTPKNMQTRFYDSSKNQITSGYLINKNVLTFTDENIKYISYSGIKENVTESSPCLYEGNVPMGELIRSKPVSYKFNYNEYNETVITSSLSSNLFKEKGDLYSAPYYFTGFVDVTEGSVYYYNGYGYLLGKNIDDKSFALNSVLGTDYVIWRKDINNLSGGILFKVPFGVKKIAGTGKLDESGLNVVATLVKVDYPLFNQDLKNIFTVAQDKYDDFFEFIKYGSIYGKKMAGLGDSISQQGWQNVLSTKYNVIITNRGSGGAKYVQDNTDNTNNAYDLMDGVDASNVDIVTFMFGANDISNDVPIGSFFDTGRDTLYGALHQTFQKAIKKFTGKRIGVIGSPLRNFDSDVIAYEKYIKYNSVIEEVAKFYRIPYLDGRYAGVVTGYSNDFNHLTDIVHIQSTGAQALGYGIGEFVSSLPIYNLFYTE